MKNNERRQPTLDEQLEEENSRKVIQAWEKGGREALGKALREIEEKEK